MRNLVIHLIQGQSRQHIIILEVAVGVLVLHGKGAACRLIFNRRDQSLYAVHLLAAWAVVSLGFKP